MTLNTRLPFRARDALAAGITRRQLASTRFRRLLPGVYVLATVLVDAFIEARAALLICGRDGMASHHLAARMHGGIVPHSLRLHVSVPGGGRRSIKQGLAVHRTTRTPVMRKGVPVTSPEDTFADLAGHLDLVDLVVLGDSLVKRGRATPASLVMAAESAPDALRRRALRAARLVRNEVDSPMETRTRMLLVLAGLPEPRINVTLRRDDGSIERRLDMAYEELRLAIEYDGRQHVTLIEQWEADVLRREELEERKWRIITLVARDIYRTPDKTIGRVVRAMQHQGGEVGRLSDAWRSHFPVTDDSAYQNGATAPF